MNLSLSQKLSIYSAKIQFARTNFVHKHNLKAFLKNI